MIEALQDQLVFSFPEVHPSATLRINFQRTLRIPDDGRDYPLPPGLGQFPLRHVDDFASRVPPAWIEHGGVMLPMYQSEAMWLHFDGEYLESRDISYPFAVKIATGKINAVSGQGWKGGCNVTPCRTMWWCRCSPGWTGTAWRRGSSGSLWRCPSGQATLQKNKSPARRSTGACKLWSSR